MEPGESEGADSEDRQQNCVKIKSILISTKLCQLNSFGRENIICYVDVPYSSRVHISEVSTLLLTYKRK